MGRDPSYAGAAGKVLTLGDVAKLGSSYVAQPKLDGIYSRIATDSQGRIASITTRNGQVLGANLMADFEGVRWMPDSIIAAEVELWTETSNRAAALRGYRQIYAFDALRVGGVDVSHEVYRVRRDALMRAQASLEDGDRDKPWTEDEHHRAHDLGSGKFTRRVPLGWRRVRVVPQVTIAHADEAWSEWVVRGEVGPCEGLVAVALDAPLGARKAKLKVKESDTIDVVVTAVGARALTAYWPQAKKTVAVARPKSLMVAVGDVVSLTHEGFYDGLTPRFARVARQRPDLN